MPGFDVFSGDAFTSLTLTDSINKMPFKPGRLGQLGLFTERGVTTTGVMLEERNGVLALIQTSQRGAPAKQSAPVSRTARTLTVPHVQKEDVILADEVQNVRAFGSEFGLEGVQSVIDQRLMTLTDGLDATLENLRVGAVKGVIYDADGTTAIYDLFAEFGVSQLAEINFDLSNSSTASGHVRKLCMQIKRSIGKELGAAPLTGVHAMCGDAFFDALISHQEVEKAYERQNDNAFGRADLVYDQVAYGGIIFENYKGFIGDVPFIHTDKAHFFPVGVPGLFMNYFAPADFVEAVNTIGLPRYAKQAPDPSGMNRFILLHAQTNPLPVCTRPRVLMKGKRA